MIPLKFLTLAQWLKDHKQCEAGLRSSVSRAYYSAFHAAWELLKQMGVVIPSGEDKHKKVPQLLESTGDQPLKEAAEKLTQLRKHRNDADYELSNPATESFTFADLRCNEASRILGALAICLSTKGTAGGRFDTARAKAQTEANRIFHGK